MLALAVALAGCAGADTSGGETPPELVGTVTAVVEEEGRVIGFRLAAGGDRYTIRIDRGRDYGFDLGHLRDHRAFADPVRVETRLDGDLVYAVRIDDA
jgi:hypothetical protein